jgi:Spy/CpxP family protein refolding chaperone
MLMLLVLALVMAPLAARAQGPGTPPPGDGHEMQWTGAPDDDPIPGPMMHGRHGAGGRAMHMAMMRQLDLSADQRARIEAIHERQARKAIQSRADIQIATLDLRKLMRAEKPDQRAIDAQIDRVAALRAGLRKAQVATMLEARAVLTPEQQKKFRELHEPGARIQSRREIRERRGGGDM